MSYPNPDRFRPIDSINTEKKFWSGEGFENTTDIINHPHKYLLTQDEIFEAEGGALGLGLQWGTVAVGMLGLWAFRPHVFKYFCRGNMNHSEWLWLGGAFAGTYYVGGEIGKEVFGNN